MSFVFQQVAWIHTNRYTLLTLQNRVITRSSRYKVSHNSHRTWWLHIHNVQERDRGEYMCQINTIPMMTQTGYLEVVGKNLLNYFLKYFPLSTVNPMEKLTR